MPFVVPAGQHMLRAVGDGQDMDVDVVLLADPVESADALFEQVRIQRQIPQDQAVRELEVASLRADLRAQQQARAIGLGEIRGVAVALHDAEAFVEARHARRRCACAARLPAPAPWPGCGRSAGTCPAGADRAGRSGCRCADRRCSRLRSVPAAAGCRRGIRPAATGGCSPPACRRRAGAIRAGAWESRRRRRGCCGTSRGRCRGGRSARRAVRARVAGLVDSARHARQAPSSPWKAFGEGWHAAAASSACTVEQPVGNLRQAPG